MAADRSQTELRVLLLAPTRRDAESSLGLFGSAGIECLVCTNIGRLCTEAEAGVGAIMLSEEAVLADTTGRLIYLVRQQPVWSDLPLIVLCRCGPEALGIEPILGTLGNVSLIERPARVATMLSVVRAALRARERQYQARDHIDARKHSDDAVRAARDAAEESNRGKDRFLAMLSHELRTPLSPVLMTVAAMQDDPELPARLREDVAMVRRNVDLEVKLIEDLLDVSRSISGKLVLQTEVVDLHDILKHAIDVCGPDLQAKGLELIVETGAGSPHVNVDAGRLQQVLWNLLKNAVKFTPERRRITVRTGNDKPGRIRIEVSDEGVGISADVLPRLFTPFEQGNPGIMHIHGGLGLGLAISKAVVVLHGGSIHAQSPGKGLGATFVVELDTCASPALTEAAREEPQDAEAGESCHILLVEDHQDTARTLSRLLTASGYRVKTAGSVAIALELAALDQFDVVLSDIGLPDATGYELMQQMKQRYGTRGIALSGYGTDEDVKCSRNAGFDDHITKPITIPQLEAVLRRVTASPRPAAVGNRCPAT